MKKTLLSFLAIASMAIVQLPAQYELPYGYDADDVPQWVQLMYAKQPDVGAVVDAYKEYYQSHVFVKNMHTQYYKRWLHSVQAGTYQPKTAEQEASDAQYLQRVHARKKSESVQSPLVGSSWTCLGPFSYDEDAAGMSYAAGSAHVYTVEQARSNPNILYAGTATAGLWKSTDKGANWVLKTAELLLEEVYAIEIDFADANVVYMSGDRKLWRSANGGDTWNEIGDTDFQSVSQNIRDIALYPLDNHILFVASNTGLYRSTNSGQSFTRILQGYIQEIEFQSGNPNIVYAIRQTGNKTEFYKSTDAGKTFALKTTGWPLPDIASEQKRTEIAVTPANPLLVYALATGKVNDGTGLYGVYVSTDAGESWNFQCCGTQPGGKPSAENKNLMGWSDEGLDDGGQQYYDLALGVSSTNPEKVFAAGVNLWHSDNGGKDFYCPSKWSHSRKNQYVHADIHDINVYGKDIWIACDGGIFYSNDEGKTFNKRMKGIAGTDFWGFGIGYGPKGRRVLVGGTYHNGTHLMDNDVYHDGWNCIQGGDNVRGFVNHANDRIMYNDGGAFELSGNRTRPAGALTFTKQPNASYIIGESSNLRFHPHVYTTLFVGEGNALWKSVDDGRTFEKLYDFGAKVGDIEVCTQNPDILYAATFGNFWDAKKLYRSTDAGKTWDEITPPAALNPIGNIPYDIVASSTNDNEVWIARTPQYNATLNPVNVLKSSDRGATWQNLTTDILKGEFPRSITHHRGTKGGIYVATRRAVYYKNNDMADWELYNDGLPAATPSIAIVPEYYGGKIVNASSRSVYEADLYEDVAPVAQISMDRVSASCGTERVHFADQSAAEGDGFVREWQFEGGVPAISAESHPVVVYPKPGIYSVVLKVTDKHGSNTHTLSNAVSITGDCSAALDIALFNIEQPVIDNVCEAEITPVVEVANFGSTTITSYTAKVYANGELQSTYPIVTNLPALHVETLSLKPIVVTGKGENKTRIVLENPNGQSDDDTSNNEWLYSLPGMEVPNGNMAVTSYSTQEDSDGMAASAIDGDEETIWHSKWRGGGSTLPHEIVFDLGDSYTVSSVKLLNRQDNSNGYLNEVEFSVSEEAQQWSEPFAITFASTSDWQTALLAGNKGRYVKMKILSTKRGTSVASIAEIRFGGCSDAVQTTVIENASSKAQGVYPNPFTSELSLPNLSILSTVRVYNAIGGLVYSGVANSSTMTLNTEMWSRGVFFIEIVHSGAVQRLKAVKM